MLQRFFAYDFEAKPDRNQWEKVEQLLHSNYFLPDPELIANLHRANIEVPITHVRDWFLDSEMRHDVKSEFLRQVEEKLPKGYIFPDLMRLQNMFIK